MTSLNSIQEQLKKLGQNANNVDFIKNLSENNVDLVRKLLELDIPVIHREKSEPKKKKKITYKDIEDGKTVSNDFQTFYRDAVTTPYVFLKLKVTTRIELYLRRVNSGAAKFELDLEKDKIPPWEVEKQIINTLNPISKLEDISADGIFVNKMNEIHHQLVICRLISEDRNRLALSGHIREGAVLSGLHESIVERRILSWEGLTQALKIDTTYSAKLRDVYRLVKK
ncbi:MAG TPA: hypothetical protein PLS50_05280 [Candidatus Dojkabacteria bacterium]|nr:hypothetical protein [Ferruginibacter sp.]HRP37195.1 hypothetical protein [Candidatus Dojkabacteria bacterium]